MDMPAEADQHNQHSTLAISTPSPAVREANLQLQGADVLGSDVQLAGIQEVGG